LNAFLNFEEKYRKPFLSLKKIGLKINNISKKADEAKKL